METRGLFVLSGPAVTADDNTFNMRYNHSECLDVVLPPSAATVQSQSPNGYVFSYHPFGNEGTLGYPCSASLASRLSAAHSSCPIMPPCSGSCQCVYAKFLPSGAVFPTMCDATKPYYVSGGGFYGGMQNMLDATGSITLDLAIKGWNDILNTQADQHGSFGNEFVCSFLKLNSNGFRCLDKPNPYKLRKSRFNNTPRSTRPRQSARRSS